MGIPTGLLQFGQYGTRFHVGPAPGAGNYVALLPPSSVSASFSIRLLTSLPAAGTEALTIDSTGQIGRTPIGGGGSVTSVALALPGSVFSISGSPVTTSGTLTGSFVDQSANTFFAGPTSGGATAPAFRAIVWGDVSGLAGTSANSFAVGNDGRFHTQGTDSGTTQTSFQIDSGNSGPRLKNESGAFRLRNAGDSADANLIVGNLTVNGTTTTVNSETVTVDDNIIVLNNNVTAGTPTEDGGVQVRRGGSTSASLLWDETNDRWAAGLVGSEIRITRTYQTTFTNAALTAGILTVNHNLGNQYPGVHIYNDSGVGITPDGITTTNANSLTIDLTSWGTLSGTWVVTCVG